LIHTRDVLKMTTVFEPRATSRNVISCTLALDLDQYREIFGGLAVPRRERLEELKAVTLRANSNIDGDPVHRRCLVCILTGVVATRREFLASGVGELEGFAVRASKSISQRVEAKIARESKSCDNVW
jgi:hypothetical protein